MKLAFFGLPLWALLLLRQGYELALVVLAPVDQPGRRRIHRLLPASRLLDLRGEAGRVEPQMTKLLEQSGAELGVTFQYTRRLEQRLLGLLRYGAIGVHPSLLPRHRGPNPLFWTIDSGDAWAGATVYRLTPEYDCGEVLLQRRIPVGELNAWQLGYRLERLGFQLLCEALERMRRGEELRGWPQEQSRASWAPEPQGDELRVDWVWPTERVLRRIRALSPVPGLALEIAGLPVFVTHAVRAEYFPRALEPGEAAPVGTPPRWLVIRTGDGAIGVVRAVASLGSELEPGRQIGSEELARLVADRQRVLDCVTSED